MFLKLDNAIGNVENSDAVRQQSEPKQLDLVLRGKRDESGNPEDWHQIYQIVGATGNHCDG